MSSVWLSEEKNYMSPLVKEFLETAGAVFSVHNHAPLISFDDAREILPHDPEDMVKGLTFSHSDGGLAIVALRAKDKADYKKIADALGMRRADLKMAEPADVARKVDMEIGGIVPLPINGTRVLIDRAVLERDEIVCGTGRNTATLVISRDEWLRAAQGEIGDFSKQA